jgi:hypothetical protein
VAGDDVAEYLSVGRQFNLWLGENVGEGSSPGACSFDLGSRQFCSRYQYRTAI